METTYSLNTPIENLAISTRARNALVRGNIKTVNDIIRLGPTKLVSCRNIGVKTYSEIVVCLVQQFGERLEDWCAIIKPYSDAVPRYIKAKNDEVSFSEDGKYMKRMTFTVQCLATYRGVIYVPATMNRDEAIAFAKDNLDRIPVSKLSHVPDSDQLDEESCQFEA